MAVPSFRNVGKIFIRITDVKKNNIKTSFGDVNLQIERQLHIEGSFKSFLTVGVETRGIIRWDRRFCLLDGKYLKYWNYPQEQEGIFVTVNIKQQSYNFLR